MCANSDQPRGSLFLCAWRIGASAYFAAANLMPSSANILPVSAACSFMASARCVSGNEPQPTPAATTEMQRCGVRLPPSPAGYAPDEWAPTAALLRPDP